MIIFKFKFPTPALYKNANLTSIMIIFKYKVVEIKQENKDNLTSIMIIFKYNLDWDYFDEYITSNINNDYI